MSQKTYINGIFANEIETQYGAMLKLSIPEDKIDDLASQLRSNASDGWIKLNVSRMREPKVSLKTGKVISTHSVSVDDWKPNEGRQSATPQPTRPRTQPAQENDDPPF